jgi:hypothetical protein
LLEPAVFGGAIAGARRYALFMTQPPDLETRVTALETQFRELDQRVRHSEQDAAAARVLAGGADREVGEMRTEIREFREVNTRMLNALRQDMIDNSARTDERLTRIEGGFTEIRGKFDAMAAGLQQITSMLTTLIERDSAEHPDAE